MRNIVIIGATSSIAEHCARLWTKQGDVTLTLVGRDAQRTERVAADLLIRSNYAEIRVVITDFLSPSSIKATADQIAQKGVIDIILIAHGSLPDQHDCEQDLNKAHSALEVNAISPVLFAEAFADHLAKANHGTLAMIGSVAGDRGRKSNYIYGAAKGLVTRYAQGLQHRFHNSGVRIILIKPGPTDTPMTSQIKAAGARLAPVDQVASDIVKGIESGKPVIYTPAIWQLIMSIIRHLPATIFNRLNI